MGTCVTSFTVRQQTAGTWCELYFFSPLCWSHNIFNWIHFSSLRVSFSLLHQWFGAVQLLSCFLILIFFCDLIIKNTPLWWPRNSSSSLHGLGIHCSLNLCSVARDAKSLSPINILAIQRKQRFLYKMCVSVVKWGHASRWVLHAWWQKPLWNVVRVVDPFQSHVRTNLKGFCL